jgi:TP901 family phage tail tape measure protein
VANYDLGTARGTIELKYKGDGPKAAGKDLNSLEKKSLTTGQAIDKTGRGFGIAGTIIAGGLAVAVKSAASFEKGLSAIQAVSGSTAGEMEKVRAKALQIGKDTKFGASDAASAMEELAKAGVSTSDILNGAADATVALAAAGEVDLPFAAGIASNAMNQFGLAAADLPKVADIIAGAANASAIDVKEFGYSLSQVGAVAKLAGLSFNDTAVAIAEMGNAGIKGSDAGTSLKTMLMRLQPQTDKQKSLMEDLGLVTKDGTNKFYDQEGRLKSLRDIQAILGNSLKGMTKEQQQATLSTLFGSDAIRGAAILAGQGAAGYDKMNTAIGKTKAADVAATRMNNLAGSFEQLKGSAETMAIQLGTVLLPTIRKIVDSVNGLLGKFLALSPAQQKIIVYVLLAVSAFLLLGAGLIKIVRFTQELIAVFRVLNLTLLANPIVLVIAAIALLVIGIILLWKHCETFRNIVKATWSVIQKVIGAVVNWFVNTGGPLFVRTILGFVAPFIGAYNRIRGAVNLIRSVVSAAFNAVVAISRAVRSAVTSAWNATASATSSAWNRIAGAVRTAINAAMAVVRGIRGRVVGALSGAGGWLVSAGRRIVQGLINGIRSMIGQVRDQLAQLTNLIPDWKGPKDRDKILLEQNGELIMQGLLNGIGSKVGPLRNLLSGITNDIPAFAAQGTARSNSMARSDGNAMASATLGTTVQVNNYNPVTEPSSVTTTKTLTRLAQLGVLG